MTAPHTVELARVDGAGDGVHWTLPAPSELNANLVILEPGHEIGDHRNDAVDVLLLGQVGAGAVVIDDVEHPFGPTTLVHVPRGTRRRIVAGAGGVRYLTVHLRRPGLGIGRA